MSFGGEVSVGTPASAGVSSSAKAFGSVISAGFQGELQQKQRERGWVGMLLSAQKGRSIVGSSSLTTGGGGA